MNSRERATDSGRLSGELLGLFAIFCGLLVILSLATFDSRDPWLNHVVSGSANVRNKAGLFGAYLAGILYDILGAASWAIPACLCLAGGRRVLGARPWAWWRWTGFALLAFTICLAGAASDLGDVEIFAKDVPPQGAGNVSTHGGGIIGHMIYVGLVGWMSTTGTFMVWLFCLILAMQMLTGISWLNLLIFGGGALWQSLADKSREAVDKRAERREARLALAQESYAPEPLEVDAVPVIKGRPGTSARALSPEDKQALAAGARDDSGGLPRPERDAPRDGEWGQRHDTPAPAGRDLFRVPYPPEQTVSSPSTDELVHPQVPRQQRTETSAPFPAEASWELTSLTEEMEFPALERTTLREPPSDTGLPRHSVHSLRPPGGIEDEEDDLPPWVVDFEEDRLGVPPHMADRVPGSDAEAAAVTSSGDMEEESIFEALEESGPDGTPVAQEPEAAAIHEPRDEDARERLSSSPPVLSARTAAAVEALRAAGAEDVPPSVSIAAATEAFKPEMEPEEETVPESTGYSGDIPIFEAPPVEAGQVMKPGLVQSVVQRIAKPVRAPLPSLDLLEAAKASSGGTPRSVLEDKGRSLMTCLQDFGVQGELVGITPGPVVTMFEVRPAPGVRVSRIANLNDDLALALKAIAVRIQAPVPGTDTVGIEIPNAVRDTVCLKELLGSQLFQQSKSLLTLALGKDIAGLPAVADLATMPHLLVAGATGAGKSVGINSIILSLLYKARPDEVKLLLIDPKRVEMAIYQDLPHLVHPVVTEMQLAKNALEWAVSEMEQRYNAIARAGVRNIGDYNAKVASWNGVPPEGMEDLVFMPYMVLIIDELADLMLVAAKEVETSIVRLAQLARAAGIHLILATQRPSVDVVTGLIKANFPCRISFQVTSKHDSRTILDAVGAEHLLGKGDMLFKPSGGKFRRMHGAFVSDQNVNSVVDYWKSRQRPDYQIDFSDWAPEGSGGGILTGGGGNGGDVASDPLYNEAVEFVRQQGKASISLIQRKFRIGFNKAARFVEQMEQDGIIGPADGSKPRLVIR